jgi:hypothetical protein
MCLLRREHQEHPMSPTGEARERKLDEIARRFRERLAEEWPEGETDVNGIEEIVSRVEREVLREVTEEMLREQSGKRKGNQSVCACGGLARYRKDTAQELVTLFGRIGVRRAYFYCERCGEGHCPQDRVWGIGPGNTTPGVQSMVGALAAFGAYQQVPQLLKRVRPQVHLGTKTVELIAQRLGAAVEKSPPPGYGRAERRLAVAVDGVILPMRGGNKEARCGVIYEPDWDCPRTPTACAGLRKEYFATLESRDRLVQTVCARVEARRPSPTTAVAALGDGADWIWEGFAKHLPHRVEILDFYHVSERLALVATTMFGENAAGRRAAQEWRAAREAELQILGPGRLLDLLEAWQPEKAQAQKVREDQLRYFRNHRGRMNYPEYLRLGFPIGSGAVEGACRHVASDRFRGTGMRWKSKTAEPLLHLRAALLTRGDLNLRPYATA